MFDPVYTEPMKADFLGSWFSLIASCAIGSAALTQTSPALAQTTPAPTAPAPGAATPPATAPAAAPASPAPATAAPTASAPTAPTSADPAAAGAEPAPSADTAATETAAPAEGTAPVEGAPVEGAVPATATATTAATAPLPPSPPPVDLDDSDEELTPAEPEVKSQPADKVNTTPPPFRRGSIALSVGLGWASSGSSSWTILGVGGGYFVIDGLKLGVDGTFWIGDKPFVSTVTPNATYIFTFVPMVQPYIGAMYRHYFVSNDLPDTDSIGGRLGVLFALGRNIYMGGGVLYEHFTDDDVFEKRDQFYPEIMVGFSF